MKYIKPELHEDEYQLLLRSLRTLEVFIEANIEAEKTVKVLGCVNTAKTRQLKNFETSRLVCIQNNLVDQIRRVNSKLYQAGSDVSFLVSITYEIKLEHKQTSC